MAGSLMVFNWNNYIIIKTDHFRNSNWDTEIEFMDIR